MPKNPAPQSKRAFVQSKTNPQIPRQLIDRTDMTWIEKGVATVLVRHARYIDGRWIAYPAQSTIADKIPTSRKSVNEAIQSMHKRGELEIIPKYCKRCNGYDVSRLLEPSVNQSEATGPSVTPRYTSESRAESAPLVSPHVTHTSVTPCDTKYKASTSSADASDSRVRRSANAIAESGVILKDNSSSTSLSKLHPEVSEETISPDPLGGAHDTADGSDGAESALVLRPKGDMPEHVCGERCECFCGGIAADCSVCYGSDARIEQHQPVEGFVPEDADGTGYSLSEAIWALNRTLSRDTPPPNDNLTSNLCKTFGKTHGYECIRQQVDWLRLRVDFATKRVESPFALLTRMIERNEPAPRTKFLNPDRINDYVDAIQRGPSRGITESEVPTYAKAAVIAELKRRNKPAQAAD